MFLRAQAWHQPGDVEKAIDQSLKDLQLNYGTATTSQALLFL